MQNFSHNQTIYKILSGIPEISQLPNINHIFDIQDGRVRFKIPIAHIHNQLTMALRKESVDLTIVQDIPTFHSKKTMPPKIKNIIAIGSGKGGVGKSTITYLLAQALHHCGAKVGVLDADIYGPSQGLLFHLDTKPKITTDKKIIPFNRDGIQVMSIGVLAQTEKALMWRGPMISQALMQMYSQTEWQDIDYLLIDLPPGTGDVHLTLIQKLALTTNLLIGTPHPLAMLDVNRYKSMLNHLESPILSTIVNFAENDNPDSDESYAIPMNTAFRDTKAIAHPEFIQLAQHLCAKLTGYSEATTNPFDNIQIATT